MNIKQAPVTILGKNTTMKHSYYKYKILTKNLRFKRKKLFLQKREKMNIGELIRMYRRKKDIKAQVVYDKLGICQSTYSKIENNKYKIDIHTLKNIAEILEIDVTKLLEEELSINCLKDEEKKINAVESNLHSEKLIESLQSQIKLLREQVQYLKKELKVKSKEK